MTSHNNHSVNSITLKIAHFYRFPFLSFCSFRGCLTSQNGYYATSDFCVRPVKLYRKYILFSGKNNRISKKNEKNGQVRMSTEHEMRSGAPSGL